MTYRFFISLIILSFSANSELFGQDNCLPDSVHTSIFQDIGHGLNDGLDLLNSPAQFISKDWIFLGGIVGFTAASFFIDKPIRNVVAKNHNRTMDDITAIGHDYGNGAYITALSGAVYLTGKLIKNNEISETGRVLLETLAYSGLITTVLKAATGRARPFTNNGPFDFFNFEFKYDYLSFPSGHTTVAFAVSAVLAAKIKNVYASIALYGLAGLTMYQRIYGDQHWFSDTFLGAAVSTVIGNALVKYNKCPNNSDKSSLIVLPSFQNHATCINLVYSF